ncbi:hypothetical protein [Pantoea piersonii]|jgi:hypothetical protein|uniref:hypothetical protein n=1 Tax=Pantoea piersonii TaxID=2364647 RepID=UPI000EA35CAC|nr:hypothetical protein [Pantoea piersonii]MBZ6385146.1 hypothetical protein [Pantoea piersonii]MBZ6385222.1 hypothetical protein [Pantoea piersonii]MBZ6398674.1 hypothetical protein [Pantoea piersonii]MBZ6398750.1 hypothetical protein [Pantoea piersonii]MBZ6406604.1 hypothetical protein [Pantoea piersonii]
MNLHGIVRGAINIVNRDSPGVMKVSLGTYTTDAAGHRTPAYSEQSVTVQMQPLSYTDLMKIDGLNLQGIKKKAYVNGNFEGVNRPKQKGGDMLIVNGETWLITQPLEEWPEWCSFVVTLQVST